MPVLLDRARSIPYIGRVKKRRYGSRRTGLDAVRASALIVCLLHAFYFLEIASGAPLSGLGIVPRTTHGLIGIVFSPFLHYNLQHLAANTTSLFVLLVILFLDEDYRPEETLLWLWMLSGLGTWLIGRGNAVHIGASSVIYGIVAYLIAAGWWLRSWRSAGIAALVLLFYGGIFYGMLPRRGMVSWEGHLSGAIAGWLVARRQHA